MSAATAIAFRHLDLEADLELVHGWMQQQHVLPWWELGGSIEVVREFLLAQAALAHLDQWIVTDDERNPFAYVETYRVPDDLLGELYDAQPGDRGFHLLVGPPELLGSGVAQALVSHLVTRLLDQYGITRIVCEPDARNTRMLTLCRALGAQEVARLELPDRTRVLLGWTRAPRMAAAA
jgi:RimJ/RimL family protein N-acetyltransferase